MLGLPAAQCQSRSASAECTASQGVELALLNSEVIDLCEDEVKGSSQSGEVIDLLDDSTVVVDVVCAVHRAVCANNGQNLSTCKDSFPGFGHDMLLYLYLTNAKDYNT